MFRYFFKSVDKILLGRWDRSSEKLTTIKVYWANMDHCGGCEEKPKVVIKALMILPKSSVKVI